MELFDDWPKKYDVWFETPIGKLVERYERELLFELLTPKKGETLLDAGCGTGVFTINLLRMGVRVAGLDISLPMLKRASNKAPPYLFHATTGDMRHLPFRDNSFEKVISVTAIEFIEDGLAPVQELFRVTKPGGVVVVATLNSLSPWAYQRKREAEKAPSSIFRDVFFRSPEELLSLAPASHGIVKTAIHFENNEDPTYIKKIPGIEKEGYSKDLDTGAFVVARWEKPKH